MDIEYIKELLRRYYAGTSSPEEERTLIRFFTSDPEIPAELEPDRKVFSLIADCRECDTVTGLPDNIIQTRIEHVIDSHVVRHRNRLRIRIFAGTAAAMLTICTGIAMHLHSNRNDIRTLTDEQVCQYTEMSLRQFMSALERGEAESEQAQESLISTTSTTITKIEKI